MVREGGEFLATLPPDRGDRRLAAGVVAVSAAVFLALLPFAKAPLPQVWPFIPIYETALALNDLITAVLLFGQFRIVRMPSLWVLAGGYLFTALMCAVHALTFPGLFSPTGLLGAGPQSTPWLWIFWHGGFPLCVIAYVLLKGGPRDVLAPGFDPRVAVLSAVAAVVATVCVFTLLATAGRAALPGINQGNLYTPTGAAIFTIVWALPVVAAAVLWRRRHSLLDLWLLVVMGAWSCDIGLSAALDGARFDLGWYAGRIFGMLAASFVLIVLLLENGKLHARLADAYRRLQYTRALEVEVAERERSEAETRRLNSELEERVHQRTADLAAANQELEAFAYSVSHDLRAPLRAIDGFGGKLERNYGGSLDAEGRRLLGVVRDNARRMGQLIDDLLAFSRMGRREMAVAPVDMAGLVRSVADDLRAAEPAERAIEMEIGDLPAAPGDGAMLRQVWINLLSNALKFTGPRVPARIEVGGRHDGEEIRYWVKDNGVGFDMQYADKLFGVFQRLHAFDEFQGTGVGLALSRRIIHRHGGHIAAESVVDGGTTFTFGLPTAGHANEEAAS
jgi:signal transduction histidine kinase